MLHDDGADDVAIVAQMRALRAAAQAASPAKADIALAALLCGQADPIANTAACRYLVEMCGIPAPAEGWPPCVRFHHGQQALVFAGTTTDGDVRGAMLVRLADGHLWVLGDLSDAPVRFPGAEDGPLLLATEPEPGLAAWAATGYELHLAPLKYLKPPTGRRVVLCRADDKPWLPPDRRVRESGGFCEVARRGRGAAPERDLTEASRFSNMGRYMKVGPDGTPTLDFASLTEDQKGALQELTVEEFTDGRGADARPVRRVKFKLYDRRAALMDLARMNGWDKSPLDPASTEGKVGLLELIIHSMKSPAPDGPA